MAKRTKAQARKRRPVKTTRVTARKVRKKQLASRVKRGRSSTTRSAAVRDSEMKRLLREERALEHDAENEYEPSALAESAEFIPGVTEDSLAEELGEAAVESETSGDQAAENIRDEDFDEEEGGPFVPSTARREFAGGTDESNPEDAEPADFPTATSRPR